MMSNSKSPLLAGLALASLCVLAAPAAAFAGGDSGPVPHDDLKARWVNWPVSPLRPIAFAPDGERLYTINQPGARLSAWDPESYQRVAELPIGPGVVSIVPRKGTAELWLVDSVMSSVVVVDADAWIVTRTIRVGAEPHGLVFSRGGDRAYVTCSGVDQLDVIDTDTYEVVRSHELPARKPRGVAWLDESVWVVPWMSGNNTAPRGAGTGLASEEVVTVEHVDAADGFNPLPDRDLFRLAVGSDAAADALDESATRTGLGTMLFDVVRRPGTSELWIPNTEALNAEIVGETNFVEGQVVQNRITVVDVAAGTQQVIDLDALVPEGTPGLGVAQPMALCFDTERQRAYVAAYGNDLIAVLDLSGSAPTWAGHVNLPPKQDYPRGTGPRGLALSPDGSTLWVLNKLDNSLARIDLTSLPFASSSATPRTLGLDPTSGAERLGRHLFSNAKFSRSGTSSCGSCHIDGETDGLAWDLSAYLDPEGTPSDQLLFALDVKGPMVTQSTRRLAETGPFHWRGERRQLTQFNDAFVTLLDNVDGGEPSDIGPDFQYLVHYLEGLAIRANPYQERDRSLTAAQLEGSRIFNTKPVLDGFACVDCHTLPLGTAGEVVAETAGGMVESAVVPSLRAVHEKLTPEHVVGGDFGTRTELGAGLTHGGALAGIQDVLLQVDKATGAPKFALNAAEAEKLTAFLRALDTGLAPATTFQVTAGPDNFAEVASEGLAYLLAQAHAGHCDVVFYEGVQQIDGTTVPVTGLYDPALGRFLRASRALTPELPESLIRRAMEGSYVTFLGAPLTMGQSLGIDRDTDTLLDLDELLLFGTDFEWHDTDGDRLPDGYELELGMDPFTPDPLTAAPDSEAPSLVGEPVVVYRTTNVIKFEFETSEPCRVHVAYNGGYPVQRLPLGIANDTFFSVVLNGLEPGTDHEIQLLMRDPAKNLRTQSFQARTRDLAFPTPAYVQSIELDIPDRQPVGLHTLQAEVRLQQGELTARPGYRVRASVYHESDAGVPLMVSPPLQSNSDEHGVARFSVPLPDPTTLPPGRLLFVLRDVEPGPGLAPYALGLNEAISAEIDY